MPDRQPRKYVWDEELPRRNCGRRICVRQGRRRGWGAEWENQRAREMQIIKNLLTLPRFPVSPVRFAEIPLSRLKKAPGLNPNQGHRKRAGDRGRTGDLVLGKHTL